MQLSLDFELLRQGVDEPVNAWPPLRIDSRVDGDAIRMVVSGELDIATDPALRNALAAAMPRRVDLDLSGISFMGCTTLTVLLQAAQDRAERGGVSICQASGPVRRLVDIAGVDIALSC